MCKALEDPRSDYYEWLKRETWNRAKRDAELKERVVEIHDRSRAGAMDSRCQPWGVGLLGAVLLALTACGDVADSAAVSPGAWAVTDSAGIPIAHNPATADWQHAPRLSLREDLRIGTIDGPLEHQFGRVRDLDVSSQGLIHVLDRQAAVVRVYDGEGRYVRTIGGPGQGPGELGPTTVSVVVGAADSVFVLDSGRRRLSVFAPDGSPVRTVDLSPMVLPAGWIAVPGGAFASRERPYLGAPTELLLRWDAHTLRADTLRELDVGPVPELRVAMPAPRWTALTDGRIAFGWSTSYRFELYLPDGTLERVLTRAHVLESYTEAETQQLLQQTVDDLTNIAGGQAASPRALEALEAVGRRFRENVRFGRQPPAFGRLIAGPRGGLWVESMQTLAEARAAGSVEVVGTGVFDVFDAAGRLLGGLELPGGFQHLRTHGDHLYGVARDDFGIHYIVRLYVEGLR